MLGDGGGNPRVVARFAGAHARDGEPVDLEIGPDAVVVRGRAGEEVLPRRTRPVLAIEVAVPRMSLRSGLRIPRGSGRGRVLWFDRPHQRDQALRGLVRAGWEVRPRRWSLLVGAVGAAGLGAPAVAVSWILALLLAAVAGGCVLQLVRNERAIRAAT